MSVPSNKLYGEPYEFGKDLGNMFSFLSSLVPFPKCNDKFSREYEELLFVGTYFMQK